MTRELIVQQKWRNKEFWAPYTDEQTNSMVELVKYLCSVHNIPLQVMEHNTQSDNV